MSSRYQETEAAIAVLERTYREKGRKLLAALWEATDKSDFANPKIGPTWASGTAQWMRAYSSHNAGFWRKLEAFSRHAVEQGELDPDDVPLALVGVLAYVAEDLWEAWEQASNEASAGKSWRRQAERLEELLREADRKKERRSGTRMITPAMRREVFKRDDHTCLACGGKENLSVDHIVPFSQGGACDLDNFQTLCMPCNLKKFTAFVDLRAA